LRFICKQYYWLSDLECLAGDVLYGDGLEDVLSEGDVTEVGRGFAVVGDDHDGWLHGRAVNLQVQGVVNAERGSCTQISLKIS